MQTELADRYREDPAAQRAQALIRSCVHCGFCTATCPSYQVLGNEFDSPRGRIDLIRELLQGEPARPETQAHLDRCLTCRACETACPSGVRYGELVEIGREKLVELQPRSRRERWTRAALAALLPSPLFKPGLRIGQWLRPLLPARLKAKLPPRQRVQHPRARSQPKQVLLLRGCVQPALAPNIEAATQRVLAVLGVQGVAIEGCCGALREHLGAHAGAQRDMARLIASCAGRSEPLLSSASGCSLMLKDIGRLRPEDPRAAALSARARDLGEWLLDPAHLPRLRAAIKPGRLPRLAWQAPCTLQHGLRGEASVADGLEALGFTLLRPLDSALCCGSAGTYSLLQPEVSESLRARKLASLELLQADVIVSANIGCISHLGAAAGLPVKHWVEVLAEQLA